LRSCNAAVEASQEEEPDVYASVSVDMPEDYQVVIPKSVTLDGSTKSGTYTVMVSGELSGEEILSITQEKSVTLSQDQKDSVTGTVAQSKTKWSCEDLAETGEGIISASDLSAGEWNGTFEFSISTLEREVFEEAITYTDFTLTADNYYMAGITRSGDVVIPEIFEYDGTYYRTKKIGNSAFKGCTEMESVSIPDSVTSIDNYAFSSCSGLTEIMLSDFISTLGNYVFLNCSGLSSIVIPKSVSNIGYAICMGCNLTSIEVSEENRWYDSRDDCNAIISKNSNSLSQGCSNTIIPEGVTSIGAYAFYGCTDLTALVIPSSVRFIGENTFSYTGLESIVIPDAVTTIGVRAFAYCSNLASVTLPKEIKYVPSWCFNGCINLTEITIPDSVTNISQDSFSGCKSLTSILIPDSVTEIGANAFNSCTNLENVTMSGKLKKIGNGAFGSCKSLVSMELPDTLVSVGSSIFSGCSSLEKVKLSNSMTVLDSYFFANCKSLTSVTIPESVTSIGVQAFMNCSSLTDIIIPDKVTSIGNTAFNGCVNLKTVLLSNSLTAIQTCTFQYCKSLTEITIPNSVKEIGNRAFEGCNGLKTIYIPAEVEKINSYAPSYSFTFSSCPSTIKIYCGASEAQPGWSEYWNNNTIYNKLSVVYGVTLEEYESLYKGK
jgi:hypothetical protein